jgi:hypothetical protein
MRAYTGMFAIVLAAAAAGAAAGCGADETSTRIADSEAPKLLIDRNWIDHMPQTHTDRLHVFRFVPSMGGGVFQDRTIFKGEFELFIFKAKERELDLVFPHNGDRVKTTYRIDRVDGPAPFDLRLTIEDSPRGPRVYYGIRAETDPHGDALEARLAAARAQLAD